MDIIQIIVVLIVVGILLWGVESMPAIDPTIKQIIRVLVIVLACLWLLGLAFPGLRFWHGRLH